MANKKMKGKGSSRGDQTFASEGTSKPPQTKVDQHSEKHSNKEFQQHDVKNRLGDYAGDGNHPRSSQPRHK